jgi:D-galactarolactone cycloisomerase
MIERAEVFVLSHRLSRTRLFSTGSNVTRDSIVVRVEDTDGRVGWGETYLAPGAVDASRAMVGELPGQDADAAAADLVARPALHRWALGAVTMALDDLRARVRGVPVSVLYGPRLRDRVRPYASSRGYVEGMTPAAAWGEEAVIVHETGFRAMKLRIGRFDLDAEVPAIDGLVGNAPAMTWMADGNGAYTHEESRRLGDRLAALGFRWLEEPLPTSDYFAYAPLARDLAIPLAGGEMLESEGAAKPYLSAGSFDLVQPDVSICGGIAGLLDIARAAASAGRLTIPHACSGVIAMAATLQVLAILTVPPNAPPWAEPLLEFDVGENPIRTDLATTPFEPVDGWMAIPDGPGLGIEVDEARMRRLAVAA